MKTSIYTIIKHILTKEETFTYQQLAQELKISSKTIRNKMQAIEDFLADFNLSLNKHSGIGITLVGENQNILNCYKKCRFYLKHNRFLPAYIREKIILFYLLNYPKKLTISTLENMLYITRPSLYNNLKQIEKLLHNYNIKLIKNRTSGIFLECGEKRKRLCLLDYAIDLFNDDLTQYHDFPLIIDFYQYIYNDYNNHNISFLKNYFNDLTKNLMITIDNYDRMSILFLISFYRIQKGYIALTDQNLLYKDHNQLIYNYFLINHNRLNQHFNIQLHNTELLYLSSLVTSNTNISHLSIKLTNQNSKIITAIDEFYQQIKHVIDINDYEYFKNKLFIYILKIIQKKEFENDLSNPNTQIIQKNNQKIFDLCQSFNAICQKILQIKLNIHTIATITLLISEIFVKNTSKLTCLYLMENNLFEREFNIQLLKSKIPNLLVVYDDKHLSNIDFVITNKPISTDYSVFITPQILDEDSLELIYSGVNKIIINKQNKLI